MPKSLRRRILLDPNDTAMVIRANGDLELVLPERSDNEEVSSDQFALISFANAFQNQRVRKLLDRIWQDEDRERKSLQ